MKKRKEFAFIEEEIRRKRSEYVRERRRKFMLSEETDANKYTTVQNINSEDEPDLKKIKCPNIICLKSNREGTISFLNYVSDLSRRNRKRRRRPPQKIKSYFDFTNIERICPASALILCSIYDMYQSRSRGGKLRVYDWEDWKPEVKEVFLQVGFFNWLEIKGITNPVVGPALPIQAFQSDTEANGSKTGTYFETLVNSFNENRRSKNKPPLSLQTIKNTASAILEAVENSVRHAYTNDYPKDIRGKWWIGGVSAPDNGEITLICYDAGISIPKHIETSSLEDTYKLRSHIREVLERFQTKTNDKESENNLDHKRLEIAMRYLESSTEQKGSGRGLSHIASTIANFTDGEIEIFSRRAYYQIRKNKRPTSKLLNVPLLGTLIIWRIQL